MLNFFRVKYNKNSVVSLIVAVIILCLNPIWPLWGGKGTAISYCLLIVLFGIKVSSIVNASMLLKYWSAFYFFVYMFSDTSFICRLSCEQCSHYHELSFSIRTR